MLQHALSEVIVFQLQMNLNSKIRMNGLGTNEIDWHKTTRNMVIEQMMLFKNFSLF